MAECQQDLCEKSPVYISLNCNLRLQFQRKWCSSLNVCIFSLYIHCTCAKPLCLSCSPAPPPRVSCCALNEVLGRPLKEANSRWLVCLTMSVWNPFSGLPGPDVLRPRGVCPGRVPLLCGLGRARMREPPGLLHGPVLWTWSFPGRRGNLQLWSQLDGHRLLHRWVETLAPVLRSFCSDNDYQVEPSQCCCREYGMNLNPPFLMRCYLHPTDGNSSSYQFLHSTFI